MTNKLNPWALVQQGYYREAIETYTRLHELGQRPFNLYNRGLTFLLMGEYRAALDDFKLVATATPSEMQADQDYIFQGVCHWYLNQPSHAVHAWRQSVPSAYTDSAGGIEPPVLLLYAAERLDIAGLRAGALEMLREKFAAKTSGWPGAIGPFLLGATSILELEQTANNSRNEILNNRQQCQASVSVTGCNYTVEFVISDPLHQSSPPAEIPITESQWTLTATIPPPFVLRFSS